MSMPVGQPPAAKRRKLDASYTNQQQHAHPPPARRQQPQHPSHVNHSNNNHPHRAPNNQHNNGHHQQPPAQRQARPAAYSFHRLLEIQSVVPMMKEIQHWMYDQCALSEHVEIEAKLGRLLTFNNTVEDGSDSLNLSSSAEEKNEEIRIAEKLGIKSLAWIDTHKTGGYFESTVNEEVFRHLNNTFNKWYSNSNCPPERRVPNLQKLAFPKLTYKRTKTLDKIYSLDKSSSIRVSIDMAQPHCIKEVIEKKKKSSMNIVYPSAKWDLRISASIENVVPKPIGQIVSSIRAKDRISYQFDCFTIDISSIHTYSEGLTKEFIDEIIHKFQNKIPLPVDRSHGTIRTYEVEFEILDQKYLQKARKLMAEKGKQSMEFQQLSYFFMQDAIQLVELASNTSYVPAVCRMPEPSKK